MLLMCLKFLMLLMVVMLSFFVLFLMFLMCFIILFMFLMCLMLLMSVVVVVIDVFKTLFDVVEWFLLFWERRWWLLQGNVMVWEAYKTITFPCGNIPNLSLGSFRK